jgi:hypothetical protein
MWPLGGRVRAKRGVADAEAESWKQIGRSRTSAGLLLFLWTRQHSTADILGVGPLGVEGPVQRHSSNPPGPGLPPIGTLVPLIMLFLNYFDRV